MPVSRDIQGKRRLDFPISCFDGSETFALDAIHNELIRFLGPTDQSFHSIAYTLHGISDNTRETMVWKNQEKRAMRSEATMLYLVAGHLRRQGLTIALSPYQIDGNKRRRISRR